MYAMIMVCHLPSIYPKCYHIYIYTWILWDRTGDFWTGHFARLFGYDMQLDTSDENRIGQTMADIWGWGWKPVLLPRKRILET